MIRGGAHATGTRQAVNPSGRVAGWQAIHFLKTIKFPIEYSDIDGVALSLFYLVARKYVESGRR